MYTKYVYSKPLSDVTERPLRKFKGDTFKQFELDIPPEYDAIVVAVNKGKGIEPVRLLLRHQLSERCMNDLFSMPFVTEVLILPTKSTDRLAIEESDKR